VSVSKEPLSTGIGTVVPERPFAAVHVHVFKVAVSGPEDALVHAKGLLVITTGELAAWAAIGKVVEIGPATESVRLVQLTGAGDAVVPVNGAFERTYRT
jgi:sugar/nucleoside kinase (ribokinase family)